MPLQRGVTYDPNKVLMFWDRKSKAYEEWRHEQMGWMQKNEDYKYYVWRDGADKAGHRPHKFGVGE